MRAGEVLGKTAHYWNFPSIFFIRLGFWGSGRKTTRLSGGKSLCTAVVTERGRTLPPAGGRAP